MLLPTLSPSRRRLAATFCSAAGGGCAGALLVLLACRTPAATGPSAAPPASAAPITLTATPPASSDDATRTPVRMRCEHVETHKGWTERTTLELEYADAQNVRIEERYAVTPDGELSDYNGTRALIIRDGIAVLPGAPAGTGMPYECAHAPAFPYSTACRDAGVDVVLTQRGPEVEPRVVSRFPTWLEVLGRSDAPAPASSRVTRPGLTSYSFAPTECQVERI